MGNNIFCLIVLTLFGLPSFALASAGGAEGGGVMDIHPGLAIWTIVTFVVLMIVLRFTAWKPILASLDERERRIRETIEKAEAARKEAEETLATYRQKLAQARDEALAMLARSEKEAASLKERVVHETTEECKQLQKRTKEEISLAKEKAIDELWEQMATVSTDIAGKILRRTITPEDHQSLVKECLNEVRQKSDSLN